MRAECLARRWLAPASQSLADGLPVIDFQMHTRWTDGASSVAEMIAAAESAGLGAIAITEHVNSNSAWWPEFVADVKAARAGSSVEVFFGAEVAAADYRGGLKADARALDAELVLGVVHRCPKQDGSGYWAFHELSAADIIELELRALKGLAANPHIDVVGHPGGTAFKKAGAFPVEWLDPAFRIARDAGIAVELNTKYLWDLEGMVALLRRVDPLLSFGSDAHRAGDVGANVRQLSGRTR
jgi:putative hydrolase